MSRPPEGVPADDGDRASATRQRVVDAAVSSILELGFYRASSNEIARRAGVTWGVIQHHFGTREALLVAVLDEGARRFHQEVAEAQVDGDTRPERLSQLVDILAGHYSRPEYLAHLQILLNLDHDPSTSADVRRTMRGVVARSQAHLQRLLGEALGPAAEVPGLATTVLLLLRGFGVSQQLQETVAYDSVAPRADQAARERALVADMLTAYLASTTA